MKNLLTDKTLKAFKEWIKNYPPMYRFFVEGQYQFKDLPDSMQYGVIVDFFDSVGIILQIGKQHSGRCWLYNVGLGNEESDTRPKARKAAVEKANELFNQIN